MKEPKPRQLFLGFAESPSGDDGSGRADESAPPVTPVPLPGNSERRESVPPAADDASRLLERVADPVNLELALARVVANRGAPGVDRTSVEDVLREKNVLLPKIRHALLGETYVPGDVRRTWIPKPGGGQRGLGIPTVVDRWVQTAVLQVLEPIFEPAFHPSSHGFRPGRSAHTAIAEAKEYVTEGFRITVDLDLASFFDRVNHQRLLDRMAQKVKDRRLLRLVRLMLKARVVLPDGTRVATEEGTPQGGPLSPLLSNIVLDELDKELDRRGLRFVRYADDCNIFVRSERAGRRVMASIRSFIERRLRLKVNEEKSAVDRSHRRHFLGFRVGATQAGRAIVQLSERTLKRLDQKIRELTPRNWGQSLQDCFEQLNSYLRGWMGYFHPCTRDVLRTLCESDAHIRRRIRAIIVRQKKRPRYLFRNLRQRGVSRDLAGQASLSSRGPWWKSCTKGMHHGYGNAWFFRHLTPLETLWRRTRGLPDREPRPAFVLKSRM